MNPTMSPIMSNLTEEQLALSEHARELARKTIAPRAAEVDRSEEYPWDNVEALTKAGFMGMTIPEEYGGLGLAISTPPWWWRKWPRSAVLPDVSSSRATWGPSAPS